MTKPDFAPEAAVRLQTQLARKHAADRRRHETGEEDDAPGELRPVGEEVAGDEPVDVARESQADRRRGVEQRAGFHPALLRHDLRHHRRPRRPFATNAERGDQPEEAEDPEIRRRSAQGGAAGVEQHGESERARPADTVGETPEEDAAGRPADEQ